MTDYLEIFLGQLVFFFGIFCLIFGAFTAYFGTGRSRRIGGGICLFGVVALIIVLWFSGIIPVTTPLKWDFGVLIEGLIAVIGAIIGAIAALGIFLGAIMKS